MEFGQCIKKLNVKRLTMTIIHYKVIQTWTELVLLHSRSTIKFTPLTMKKKEDRMTVILASLYEGYVSWHLERILTYLFALVFLKCITQKNFFIRLSRFSLKNSVLTKPRTQLS